MTATEISSLLSARADQVASYLLPNGVKNGHDWCVGSVSGEAGKSCRVCIEGSKAGVWADFGEQGKKGDLIGLWMETKNVNLATACDQAMEWLGVAMDDDWGMPAPVKIIETKAPSQTWAKIQAKMRKGTSAEISALAKLRKIPATEGLELASNAGHLWFGDVWDDGFEWPAWIITDETRRNAQARRMDGKLWGKGLKAKTIQGCEAKWPVGLQGVNGHDIAFVEGSGDILAAWHCIAEKGLNNKISPVAMFGASMTIPDDALPLFSGKRIFTFPHDDAAGHKAMDKWASQLRTAKVLSITPFDFKPSKVKDLNDFVSISGSLDKLFKVDEIEARPITSYAYPFEDDPNILLGKDDYLGKGGGMLFVSHAGAGKSSWIIDACMMWALGLPWMGLKCSRKLKSLIVQAEDSDRYIGKIASSFIYKNKLEPTEITEIGENCVIARVKGMSGIAFLTELERLTNLHKPDLVIINPIYLYADGDISKGEVVQKFLLGLDQINKAEQFAYILIHHTGKPTQKDKSGKRAEVEDWESAYMGIGSSFWANWPRCSALLEPVAGKHGSFMIKLGKGGFNAGIVKEVEQGAGKRLEPCTRIAIKHSTEKMPVNGNDKPVYYWELDTDYVEAVNPKGSGRKQKYEIETFFESFPTSFDTALPAVRIHKLIDGYSSIPPSSFKDLCQRAYEMGKIKRADKPNLGMSYWVPKSDPVLPAFKDNEWAD